MPRRLILLYFILFTFLNFSGYAGSSLSEKEQVQNPKLSVYVVDVGLGDAIFLDIPPKYCMLIDAGSWDNDGVDHLIYFLDEFFDKPGHEEYDRTIDVVVATNQQKDHVQGMLDILKKFNVGAYIDNGVGCMYAKNMASELVKDIEKMLKLKSIKHAQITDQLIKLKGKKGVYTDRVLDPFENVDIFALAATPNPVEKDENDNSIVLKVNCDDVSFLITGNAGIKEERIIMDRLEKDTNMIALDVDVLKVGCHGSNTASSEEFLQLVTPKISIVSVGSVSESPMTKKFRLPKESVVKRIEQYTSWTLDEEWEVQMFLDKKPKGAKNEKPKTFNSDKEIYFTSSDGTIVFKTDGKKLIAEPYE
jgi:beta-lactamase superfamily II metal-dependent hydrolase